jgi:NAD(P)-dependent dehydrogenase (short-subunit alcohol dehydrogenase family)
MTPRQGPGQCRLGPVVLDHARASKGAEVAYQPFDLAGKVALVTGGNRGIGFGIAQAVAQAGADIAIWGTNADKNAEAKAELAKSGRKVVALQCDVGDEAAVDAAFTRTLEELGRVDGCFANAGIGGGGASSFLEMSSELWHRVLRTNLDGAFYTFRAAARHMVERGGGGVLVGTASLAAIEAAPRSEHYAATKGGVISMVRGLAVEFARYNVRAHAILPGWIETDMTHRLTTNDTFHGKVMPRIPMRRWGKGDDFGGIAVYLMSEASRYHTGDTFVIDGGYSLF